jgi:aldose 1-epimerase
MPETIELRAGELRLALRADLGGCIAGLWHSDTPVLRSTEPAALETSRTSGCFPLVPYSNRLGYRRFRWQGHDYTTAPNFDDSLHSLHGVAWQRPWSVEGVDAASAVLHYRHRPDAHWPFEFDAVQRFALDEAGIGASLALTNLAAHAQPAGLGWHPYFPKRSRSRLHVEIDQRWESDPTGLPTRRIAQPGIDADVAHLDFDHCFEGWRGSARIRDERLTLTLSSPLPYLVVFTPRARAYFCVEPVSHVSNAIHMADPGAHGLATLEPGATLEATMRLEVRSL